MWQVLAAVVALIGATFGAYFGTRQRIRAELEGQYDSDLRKLRLSVYPTLWAITETFARYAREPAGTRPDKYALEGVSRAMRRWYFNTGGLYLSAEARDAYFLLQKSLEAVVTSERWRTGDVAVPREIDAETFEALRELSSWLRTVVTYDVGTRQQFSLAPDWQGEVNQGAVDPDREAKQRAGKLAAVLERAWGAGTT